MSDPKATAEPSIEDILGSIRRIIADEEPAASPETGLTANPPAAPGYTDEDDDDAPLELTQKIDADGTVIDLEKNPNRYDDADDNDDPAFLTKPSTYDSTPAPQSSATDSLNMINFDDAPPAGTADPLMSNVAANATAAVMAKLARNTAVSRPGHDGATIEDLVKDMLRPLLREWLDKNLPEMVQSMVERELEKISRRVG